MVGLVITDLDLSCKPYPLAYKRRGRGVSNTTNHNTSEQMMYGCYPLGGLNLSKTLVFPVFPSISTFVSTPTLNRCHKL
jgi:hypothetical protein